MSLLLQFVSLARILLCGAVVPPSLVEAVKEMLSNIRDAFREKFRSSSWLAAEDRVVVLRKLGSMKTHVGSPGRRHEEDYVEDLYKAYPDVPQDRLFPSWIKAMSLSAHQLWADQETYLYDETAVSAHYVIQQNTVVIPTAIISRPLFYDGGPPALNYGGLGGIVGHEMMHAYDVLGKDYDDEPGRRNWSTPGFIKEYTKRTLCLRRSYRAALRRRSLEEVNDTIDSENLADLVGARVAYAAFSSLPQHQQDIRLPSLNISAARLFFIGHCLKWCSEYEHSSPRYAPYRSRCIVPLMNMPEFSHIFGCKAGQPMNPVEKCKFWS